MWKLILATIAIVVLYTAAIKGGASARRRRGLSKLPADRRRREAHGLDVKVMLRGARPYRGLLPNRTNRTTADLALGEQRFIMATNHGVLVDLTGQHGRRFTSVRCPGPGRLVFEGKLPQMNGPDGTYRIELVIRDAGAWARELAPFADEVVTSPFVGPS